MKACERTTWPTLRQQTEAPKPGGNVWARISTRAALDWHWCQGAPGARRPFDLRSPVPVSNGVAWRLRAARVLVALSAYVTGCHDLEGLRGTAQLGDGGLETMHGDAQLTDSRADALDGSVRIAAPAGSQSTDGVMDAGGGDGEDTSMPSVTAGEDDMSGSASMDGAMAGTSPGEPDAGLCSMVRVVPEVRFVPGNLLIVLDRSMSMSIPFPGMTSTTSRFDNARHAIANALQPFVCPDALDPDGPRCTDPLRVALLTFPTYDGVAGLNSEQPSCTVDSVDSEEQIDWQGVTGFVEDLEPFWASRPLVDGGLLYPGQHPLTFGTPTSIAFARANEALMDPGVFGNRAVLFLADGEESGDCQGGADAVSTAGEWDQMGVKTHVLSLAMAGGSGQSFNDRVAMAGGTGQSISPADSAQLTAEISRIVTQNLGRTTCEVTIENAKLGDPMMACEGGEVYVQSVRVPCDQRNMAEGFWVKSENTIEIVGSHCHRLQETMDLRAAFPCE